MLLGALGSIVACSDEDDNTVTETISDPSYSLDVVVRQYFKDSVVPVVDSLSDTIGYRPARKEVANTPILFFRHEQGKEIALLRTRTDDSGSVSSLISGQGYVAMRVSSNLLGEFEDSVRIRKGVMNFFEFKIETD